MRSILFRSARVQVAIHDKLQGTVETPAHEQHESRPLSDLLKFTISYLNPTLLCKIQSQASNRNASSNERNTSSNESDASPIEDTTGLGYTSSNESDASPIEDTIPSGVYQGQNQRALIW